MRGNERAESERIGDERTDNGSGDDSRTDGYGGDGRGETSGLVAEDLAVGYPATDEPVLECDTVLLPAGEITALVGPNGSGKSTLLRAFAGDLDPERGSVLLDGADVHDLDPKTLARDLGVLSQENDSPGSLTVESLAEHGRYPHRGFLESLDDSDYAAVDRALELAGVTHLRDEKLGELSGGQKQLAWLAMVLAQETDVLLLDEPTTFLDLRHQLRVLDVLRTLNRERDVTVGVVLHDVAQAARVADNLVALRDGEPYDWGPPDEVVTERMLADVFGVEAAVGYGPEGPQVTPLEPLDE